MTEYVQDWCANLMSRLSQYPANYTQGWGECNLHLGPRIMRAKVKIGVGPGNDLRVTDQLVDVVSARLKRDMSYEYIIFGVLDILMTDLRQPYGKFELTLLDAEIDELNSSAMAFRLAARDATTKMLPDLW